MENKENGEGTRCWDVPTSKKTFDSYAQRATHFSLRKRLISGRAARRYAPLSATALMALSIHLFKAE